MLFSIICLSRKFSVSCKRLFETRYFSATDWKQTVAFSLPTILYKNVTTRWIRPLHHFNPTPRKAGLLITPPLLRFFFGNRFASCRPGALSCRYCLRCHPVCRSLSATMQAGSLYRAALLGRAMSIVAGDLFELRIACHVVGIRSGNILGNLLSQSGKQFCPEPG